MATDALGKLFGSPARVKLLRLFLFNPTLALAAPEAARRVRIDERDAAREMSLLLRARLLKGRRVFEEERRRRRGKTVLRRRRVRGAILNSAFPYVEALQKLLMDGARSERELLVRLRKAGRLKLLIVAGALLGEFDRSIDVLIVGEKLKHRRVESIFRSLEAELGRELRYVVLTPSDFSYRHNVNDKVIRDVLDYPHHVVYDRLGVH